jgi:hypothetical protein
MVQAYNDYREKQLYKYFKVLENSEVSTLLQDNHIQRKDVKAILHR